MRLVADDGLPYIKINDQNNQHTLQKDLKNLEVWTNTCCMMFNASKCYIISIKDISNYFYQLNYSVLRRVSTNPYFGLTISEDLNELPH